MSYKSPIDIIYGNIETKVEDDVVKAIQSYNISVDKDELIKALNYDREQYKAGYKSAIYKIKVKIVHEMMELHPHDYNGLAMLQGIREYIEELESEG